MDKKILEVNNLSISFSQYGRGLNKFISNPIKSLSIEIKEGEILAIIGASGSGKSLLAHAIMGILPPNSIMDGEIFYKGEKLNIHKIKMLRGKEIAFIPQSVNYLDPSLKVKDQVQIGLPKDKKVQIQEKLFKKYGLKKSDGELYPYQLSGGMLRRVLFATSVKDDIKLVIADEPTPGIDPEALESVLQQLKQFAKSGIGVMLITHDIMAALKIADNICVFKDGKNVEIAPAKNFQGKGELLKEKYTRMLWKALPENEFIEMDEYI